MADAEGNDEWLGDTAGYGQIFVPAGIELEFCKPGFVSRVAAYAENYFMYSIILPHVNDCTTTIRKKKKAMRFHHCHFFLDHLVKLSNIGLIHEWLKNLSPEVSETSLGFRLSEQTSMGNFEVPIKKTSFGQTHWFPVQEINMWNSSSRELTMDHGWDHCKLKL